jgi:signal transduction histidine kinase
MGKGGVLELETANVVPDGRQGLEPRPHVMLAVRDDGCGMSPEVKARIFEPFFTTKEVGRGTGQGLALAWAAVKEKHAGELTFETRIGEGTTFFIRLPIAGAGAHERAGACAATSASHSGTS